MDVREELILKMNGGKMPFRILNAMLKKKNEQIFTQVHYHEHIEILYGVSGEATALVSDKTYKLTSKDMIIIYSNEPHDVVAVDSDAHYYVIQFLPTMLYADGIGMPDYRYFLPMWKKYSDFSHLTKKESLIGSGIDGQISSIIREWNERSYGYELMIKSDIIKIFISFLRLNSSHINMQDEHIPASLKSSFEKLMAHLEQNYSDFSAQDAADYCNLSYSYFSRSFKHVYGLSFSEYIETMRLRESERMLLTTDKSITEIAIEVGFNSSSYFAERFKLRYHISPHAFRARTKSAGNELH